MIEPYTLEAVQTTLSLDWEVTLKKMHTNRQLCHFGYFQTFTGGNPVFFVAFHFWTRRQGDKKGGGQDGTQVLVAAPRK